MFLDNGKTREEMKVELEAFLRPNHEGIVDWYISTHSSILLTILTLSGFG